MSRPADTKVAGGKFILLILFSQVKSFLEKKVSGTISEWLLKFRDSSDTVAVWPENKCASLVITLLKYQTEDELSRN